MRETTPSKHIIIVVTMIDKPEVKLPPRNMGQRLMRIYSVSGIRGIFAGLGPRLFKVAPACAIMISTFEYSKSFFYQYNIKLIEENAARTD